MPRPQPHPKDFIEQRIAREDRGHSTPCWIWQLSLTAAGYARTIVYALGRRQQFVHRVAYELWVGPIPDGLTIDHLCKVRNCVNPDHLEPVTMEENWRRAGLLSGKCSKGHSLENNRNSVGLCIICHRLRASAWKKANRERCRSYDREYQRSKRGSLLLIPHLRGG